MNIIKKGALLGLIAFVFLIIYSGIIGYQTAVYYSTQTNFEYSTFTTFLFNFMLLISGIGMIFYFLAFLDIGKKYENKLLKVVSKILVILAFISLFLTVLSVILSYIPSASAAETATDSSVYAYIILVFILIIFVVIASVLTILFGIGIKNLGKEVKHSRVTGILYILSGATMIIFVGFILLFVANFYAVALLWKEGNKAGKVVKKSKK
jgi:membrane-bound acyltransferase YfiQ involved in biofilm formation